MDDSAFDHCSSLKIVVLPSTTDIGSEVFKATKLFELSPFDTYDDESDVNTIIRTLLFVLQEIVTI